jgi:8-oxo-dGTP pyrophosphatase MutT (NUDIX family)
LFEQSKNDYIFCVGGRIKINESSIDAAKREVEEELNFKVNDLRLKGVMENFYSNDNDNVHEICFIYEVEDIFTGELPSGFLEVKQENINNYDVRPKPIIDLVVNNSIDIKHIIVR